ncbi:MAG TPA: GTP-binding protein [Candidatus Udaeobacter sp.]|jgi:G3E family GTPase|nr:GTP-binding protein [Candidatus Udaeobacter sp.]
MTPRTPITLITGPLGSGKTTLLRHILDTRRARIAVVMNEFGELAIDTKVIKGKNVQIAELGGGCVCCSLLGEFEAAITEIIKNVAPEMIVVETTGLAEPEALVFNIQEALPQCRLDGVVSIIDADMLVRFPELGHTTRLQIEGADILLLNKIDLVDAKQIESLETRLCEINPSAPIICTDHCQIDPELLSGIPQSREKKVAAPRHLHQPEFESFAFSSDSIFSCDCFISFADALPASVIRAKGFVRFADGTQLFNFVAGRWELEPFESNRTELVFIGKNITRQKSRILHVLRECQIKNDEARMTSDERMPKPE